MRSGLASVFASLGLAAALPAAAEAACTWRLNGQIVRTDTVQLVNGSLSTPGMPLQVMAMVRWSAGCPGGNCVWNTSNWLPGFTDADGNFSIFSGPIPDPSCQAPRDVIILYRGETLDVNHWQTVDMVSNRPGPNQPSGPTPVSTFIHTANLGQLKADDLGLPPGAQLPEEEEDDPTHGATMGNAPRPGDDRPPSGVMTPAPTPGGGSGLPTGTAEPGPGPAPQPGSNGGGNTPPPAGTAGVDPCGFLRNPGVGQPDFTFAQHPMAGGQGVSPGGEVRIAQRQNAAGQRMSRRVNATFQVNNAGNRDHGGSTDNCPVTATVRFNEGPGLYDDPNNWHSYAETLPTIPMNFPRLVTVQGTLRGTGNDTASDWNESYTLVAIEIELDDGAMVAEANEGDNTTGILCYDAVANDFVDPQTCSNAILENAGN